MATSVDMREHNIDIIKDFYNDKTSVCSDAILNYIKTRICELGIVAGQVTPIEDSYFKNGKKFIVYYEIEVLDNDTLDYAVLSIY